MAIDELDDARENHSIGSLDTFPSPVPTPACLVSLLPML